MEVLLKSFLFIEFFGQETCKRDKLVIDGRNAYNKHAYNKSQTDRLKQLINMQINLQ
jgi:hypothetical protein